MLYPNLKAEIARKNWSVKTLATVVGMSVSTLNNKLYGQTELKYSEAKKIKEALGVDMPLEVLFEERTVVA